MLKKSKILHGIRLSLEEGSLLTVAWRKAGLNSSATLHRWRKESPRIDRYIKACQEKSNDRRVAAVEDAYFKKLIDGKGSAADYIFWLTNRCPDRWINKYGIEHSGKVEGGETIIATPHAVIFSAVKNECQISRP